MLTVLTWKWRQAAMRGEAETPAQVRRRHQRLARGETVPKTLDEVAYTAEHVNRLAAMVARQLPMPHRFVCITDDPTGLDPRITVLPMPPGSDGYYRCTRRLLMFAEAMRGILGDRVLHLDLDTVLVGDLTPLATRPEPLVVWWATSNRTRTGELDRACNPSFALFDAGILDGLWQAFCGDPDNLLDEADRAGWHRANSDQCILSYWLDTHRGIPVAKVGEAEGLYSFRDHVLPTGQLPADARLIGFYDPRYDPSDPALQAAHPWIAAHWTC